MIQGRAIAHPSLAMIKYWGKRSYFYHTPATDSLAVTVDNLETITTVQEAEIDQFLLNGQPTQITFSPFLDFLRGKLGLRGRFFSITTWNNFPTAAGLASSSSGFAALTGAFVAFSGKKKSLRQISGLTRLGSGSATRSVFGGFTSFSAGAKSARQEQEETFWPELRVVVAIVSQGKKLVSSTNAMKNSHHTSPYYSSWIHSSPVLFKEARKVLAERRLELLGPLIRQSYLRMFATIFTSDPPLFYWQPESLEILLALEELRMQGLQVWETMDAGPQVKIFCLENDVRSLVAELEKRVNHDGKLQFLVTKPAKGLQISRLETP